MNDTHATNAKPNNARSDRARRWKYVERAFSLAAIAVVIWLGWSTVTGMQQLFQPDAFTPTTNKQNQPADPRASLPMTIAALNAGGYWQMADWQWEIGSTTVEAAEVESRLSQLAECSLPQNLSTGEVEAMTRLMKALNSLPSERTELGDQIEYRIENPSQKVRILTSRKDGNEVLVALGAAIQNPGDRVWKVLELRSRPTKQVETMAHLVPLSSGSQRLCGRTDDRGSLLFEVVKSPVEMESLANTLKTGGWTVTPFSSPRYQRQQETSFLCAKQNDLVHIWSIPSGGGETNQSDNEADSYQIALMRVSRNDQASNRIQRVNP